jgi:hypothetical protein
VSTQETINRIEWLNKDDTNNKLRKHTKNKLGKKPKDVEKIKSKFINTHRLSHNINPSGKWDIEGNQLKRMVQLLMAHIHS